MLLLKAMHFDNGKRALWAALLQAGLSLSLAIEQLKSSLKSWFASLLTPKFYLFVCTNIYFKSTYIKYFIRSREQVAWYFNEDNHSAELFLWNSQFLWQLPLLAHPGPAKDAIHWALLSLLFSSSRLIASSLLPAASLAAGVISPTLVNMHIAWARTAVVEISRRYCPTIMPSILSDCCRPVDRVR